MPPTRYRVVEQGRRLIVIDNRVDRSVRPTATPRPEMPAERPRTLSAPRPNPPGKLEPRGRYAGGEALGFVTARWYDDEGPRRIRLDADGRTQLVAVGLIALAVGAFMVALVGWPILLVLGFLLFQPKARRGARSAATVWLTALDSTP